MEDNYPRAYKEVYFFDEPTSNLDALSEEKITNMIEKYLKDKTYVIVTHRPKLINLGPGLFCKFFLTIKK